MKIISKKEAEAKGLKRFFTGKPCRRGHVAEKFISNYACAECNTQRCNEKREELNAWNRKRNDRRRDYIKKHNQKYYVENKDTILKNNRKYYEENKEWLATKKLEWQRNNKGKVKAIQNKRRAIKLQALPNWANLDKIKEIYLTCPNGFDVDHILPLNNKLICGLHVEFNLQHLPEKENASKSNKFVPYVEKDGEISYLS